MLRVGGLIPLSTVDYPGRLAAVLFCQGCSWRCGYCHNPHLQALESCSQIPSAEVWGFLEKRRNLLDAVVISGGEPLLQEDLWGAIQRLKGMGFEVVLHTSGSHPERLLEILPELQWIGLDIKALVDDYHCVSGIRGSGEKAWKSLSLILQSEVDFEVRTTIHWALHSPQSLLELAQHLSSRGVKSFALQEYRARPDLKHELPEVMEPLEWPVIREEIASLFKHFSYRK